MTNQTEDKTTGEFVPLRTPYNYDRDESSFIEGSKPGIDPETNEIEKSLTTQADLESSDINNIVQSFGITGEVPTTTKMPMNADFREVFDFQSAQNAIRQGVVAFAELPAKQRARFSNDPAQFLEFLEDPENRPEAEKMGYVIPRQPEPEKTPQNGGNKDEPQK